jgi:hypothetical protein
MFSAVFPGITRVAVTAPIVTGLEGFDGQKKGIPVLPSALRVSVPLNVYGREISTRPIVQFAPVTLEKAPFTVIDDELSTAAVTPLVNVVIVKTPGAVPPVLGDDITGVTPAAAVIAVNDMFEL